MLESLNNSPSGSLGVLYKVKYTRLNLFRTISQQKRLLAVNSTKVE
jgi:hypothetical protein